MNKSKTFVEWFERIERRLHFIENELLTDSLSFKEYKRLKLELLEELNNLRDNLFC